MAVRGGVRVAGAAAVALLIGLTGPGAGAQEQPAPHTEETAPPAPLPTSIREVLTGRSDRVTGSAEGGFGGDDTLDVTLRIENRTSAPVTLVVPRGSLFASEEETEQTAVTVGPEDEDPQAVEAGVDPTITVAPGEHEFQLAGFCAQHEDSGPSEIVPMSWAGVAEEPLTTVLTTIAKAQPSNEEAQHAVWWLTDVPVIPVPDDVAPLLDGVDTAAFAANPTRVVMDERYTPTWAGDAPLDPDDPFGDAAYGGDDSYDYTGPSVGDGPFSSGSDDGSGPGIGLYLLAAVVACGVISVVVARAGRRVPAAAGGSSPGAARSAGTATPPGWHPDPQEPTQLRWWDGSGWTNDTRPF